MPGRHGYRLVLATWAEVTQEPDRLLGELDATIHAPRSGPGAQAVEQEVGELLCEARVG